MMKRYKELRFQDKIYTEPYKIDEILIKNGFDWFLDCEVENVRIEILKNTLVFNSGVFFNGTWVYGVFRDGQWKYGTWEGGVWYNGTFYNGIFKNGLIFNGRFINGKIEGGEIRGGEFFDVEISKSVVKNIEKENKNSPKPQQGQGQPQNRGKFQKIQGQTQPVQPQPVQEQSPKVQGEKIEERIKRFESFTKKIIKMNNLRTFEEFDWKFGFGKDKNSISSIFKEFGIKKFNHDEDTDTYSFNKKGYKIEINPIAGNGNQSYRIVYNDNELNTFDLRSSLLKIFTNEVETEHIPFNPRSRIRTSSYGYELPTHLYPGDIYH